MNMREKSRLNLTTVDDGTEGTQRKGSKHDGHHNNGGLREEGAVWCRCVAGRLVAVGTSMLDETSLAFMSYIQLAQALSLATRTAVPHPEDRKYHTMYGNTTHNRATQASTAATTQRRNHH